MGFKGAVEEVLKHEGGYVNDPDDPGGETKYGISKRTYPNLDIRNLTEDEAVDIYRNDWWDKYDYGSLPEEIGEKVFDFAVNMGADRSHKLLQLAMNEIGWNLTVDGILGPKTRAAIRAYGNKRHILDNLRLHAVAFYASLAEGKKPMRKFLIGWIKRALD